MTRPETDTEPERGPRSGSCTAKEVRCGRRSPLVTPAPASALEAFKQLTGHLSENGLTFGTQVLGYFGFQKQGDGTYVGTTVYADGTTLALSAGFMADGTLDSSRVGFCLRRNGSEVVRVDIDLQAKKPRDKVVHAHLHGRRNHIYVDGFSELITNVEKIWLQDGSGDNSNPPDRATGCS